MAAREARVTGGVRTVRRAAWFLFALGVVSVTLVAAAQRPQRIISLVPAVTEMLFALGVGDRVVAVSSFDTYPPEVQKLQRVGALLDPDLERILSLRPDLVAVYGSQADLREQLGRAGVPMFIYAHAGLADVTTTIRSLGDRVGASEKWCHRRCMH